MHELGESALPVFARDLEQLWRSGAAGAPAEIERRLAEDPSSRRPAFLRGPRDTQLVCALAATE